jgi:uncharacterized iron-regulated membrane protein
MSLWFDVHSAVGIFSRVLLLWLTFTGIVIGFESVSTPFFFIITHTEEYLLKTVQAGQDIGEPPHATADVEQAITRAGGATWNAQSALFFHLLDVAEVTNALTGELVFRAA